MRLWQRNGVVDCCGGKRTGVKGREKAAMIQVRGDSGWAQGNRKKWLEFGDLLKVKLAGWSGGGGQK